MPAQLAAACCVCGVAARVRLVVVVASEHIHAEHIHARKAKGNCLCFVVAGCCAVRL